MKNPLIDNKTGLTCTDSFTDIKIGDKVTDSNIIHEGDYYLMEWDEKKLQIVFNYFDQRGKGGDYYYLTDIDICSLKKIKE